MLCPRPAESYKIVLSTERHLYEAVHSAMEEGIHLLPILIRNLYLPVPAITIEGGKDGGVAEAVDKFIQEED